MASELENLSNEALGALIREILSVTGQGLYLPPVRWGRFSLNVLTELPPADDYYQIGEYRLKEESKTPPEKVAS